jgi:hypothetical protein
MTANERGALLLLCIVVYVVFVAWGTGRGKRAVKEIKRSKEIDDG